MSGQSSPNPPGCSLVPWKKLWGRRVSWWMRLLTEDGLGISTILYMSQTQKEGTAFKTRWEPCPDLWALPAKGSLQWCLLNDMFESIKDCCIYVEFWGSEDVLSLHTRVGPIRTFWCHAEDGLWSSKTGPREGVALNQPICSSSLAVSIWMCHKTLECPIWPG